MYRVIRSFYVNHVLNNLKKIAVHYAEILFINSVVFHAILQQTMDLYAIEHTLIIKCIICTLRAKNATSLGSFWTPKIGIVVKKIVPRRIEFYFSLYPLLRVEGSQRMIEIK
jgi:isoprenylcysteine carboxyl methyltransferase (ICMT) family protein YpbQ